MAENMPVYVEVWPVAADRLGIWLVSGTDAWRASLPVYSDDEPHSDVNHLLSENGARRDALLTHSTSWRVDGNRLLLTYVVVLGVSGNVRERWPEALPIDSSLTDVVGKPFDHDPTDPPTPRYIDVLMHALRHLAFLRDNDSTSNAALTAEWRTHLEGLHPALAGMYFGNEALPATE